MQATPGPDDRLREVAWTTEHCYRMLHTSFCVRADDAVVADEVDALLSPFRLPAPPSRPRRRYALVAAETAQAGAHALYRDDCLLARASWPRLLAALVADLNASAVEEFEQFAVHAGAVAHEGAVVAFPAASGAGKSTVTAACLRAGFDYVSDEALCVDFSSGAVLPYPKPLMLSARSRSLVGLRTPAGFLREADNEAFMVAGDVGARVADGPLRLTNVVQLARGGGPPKLHPLPPSQVVALLLGTSFNHYKRPLDAFDLVTRLARRSRVWRLEYDDPALAARLLAQQLAPAVSPTVR